MDNNNTQDIVLLKSVLGEFIVELKNEVEMHPHNFFLEEDLRCLSYALLYNLLKENDLLNAKTGKNEIRLRASFNPYSYHKHDDYKNVAYDLAITDEDADNELCIIEFKFNKRYDRFGKRQKYGGASLSSLQRDYLKISKEKAPFKYCILVAVGIERDGEIDEFINSKKGQDAEMHYFVNESD